MNDTEAQLAERLAKDLERVLGTGIVLEDLEIEGEGPVVIRAACLVDGRSAELRTEGATVLEAMSEVVRIAAETRLSSAFWHMVGPG
jgi:hypothetical protein